MKRLYRWTAVLGVIVMAQGAPLAASGAGLLERLTRDVAGTHQTYVPLDGSPATISYSEEVPCPSPAPHALRHRRHRRRVHRAPRPRPPHATLAPARPHVKHVVRHRRHVLPRRPIVAAAPAKPPRCEIMHRERLYRPGLAVDQDLLSLVNEAGQPEITPFVSPVGLIDATPPAVTGLVLVIPSPGVFGGGGYRPRTPRPPPVTGAPEPQTWALMLCGVALVGGALRRKRRALPDARAS